MSERTAISHPRRDDRVIVRTVRSGDLGGYESKSREEGFHVGFGSGVVEVEAGDLLFQTDKSQLLYSTGRRGEAVMPQCKTDLCHVALQGIPEEIEQFGSLCGKKRNGSVKNTTRGGFRHR